MNFSIPMMKYHPSVTKENRNLPDSPCKSASNYPPESEAVRFSSPFSSISPPRRQNLRYVVYECIALDHFLNNVTLEIIYVFPLSHTRTRAHSHADSLRQSKNSQPQIKGITHRARLRPKAYIINQGSRLYFLPYTHARALLFGLFYFLHFLIVRSL